MKLYKYRTIYEPTTNDLTIDALLNNYFWAASKESLNDPCEGYYSTESYDSSLNFMKLINPKIDTSELDRNFKSLNQEILNQGIFSLSKSATIHSLWAHYANNHEGICIEYDLNDLIGKNMHLYQSFDITYSSVPPDIKIEDIPKKDVILKKIIGYKHVDWSPEQEFRIISHYQGKNHYRSDAVKSIIFGLKTEISIKNKLMQMLCNRNIKFKQIIKSIDNYELHTLHVVNPFDSKDSIDEKNEIQFEDIVPNDKYIKDEYKDFKPYLYKVVEIMSSYPDCEELFNMDFSEKSTPNNPIIYVNFREKGSTIPYSQKLFRVKDIVL